MESGKVKASELLHRRNTVEEFYSPAVRRIKLLTSRCHYPLKPVAQLAHVRGGKRLPPATPYIENHDGSGIPYIRTCDIRPESGVIDLSNVVYVDEATHQVIRNYQLQQNDIVISIAGTIGAVGMLREPLERCNFNENMAKVRVFDSELLPEYVAAYFDSGFGQAYIRWLTGGAVQAKLSLERIEQILVPAPPLEVQRRVAKFMQDAYAERGRLLEDASIIGGDEYVLAELGLDFSLVQDVARFRLKQSQMKEWDEIKYHLPLYKQREEIICTKGLFPAVPFGHLVEFSGETIDPRRSPDQPITYVEIGGVNAQTWTIENSIHCLGADAPTRARMVVHTGDVITATSGACTGTRRQSTTVIPETLDGAIVSTGFAVLRPKANVLRGYVLTLLRSDFFLDAVMRRKRGAAIPAIGNEDFKSIPVPMPSVPVQERLSDATLKRIAKAEAALRKSKKIIAAAQSEIESMILGEDFTFDDTDG